MENERWELPKPVIQKYDDISGAIVDGAKRQTIIFILHFQFNTEFRTSNSA